MGDRAIVVFKDKNGYSPGIYLHWLGSNVPEMIDELKPIMATRPGDAEYASARFCALACEKAPGNLSVGLLSFTQGEIEDDPVLLSQGDAGFIIVDATTFKWEAYGSYLKEKID